MGYLIAIAIGLALIGAALAGIFAILEAIAKGAAETKSEFILKLGRKHLGAKAFIPNELAERPEEMEQPRRGYQYSVSRAQPEYPSPLPPKDTDAADFNAYAPSAAIPIPWRPSVFNGAIEQVFKSDFTEPTSTIDIDRITELLNIEFAPPYEPLFASLGSNPSYFASPPKEPPQIASPPPWTPWQPAFAEPFFEPPYYGARLSFLNRFVDIAHRAETDKVRAAIKLRKNLMARCVERNPLWRRKRKPFTSPKQPSNRRITRCSWPTTLRPKKHLLKCS